MAVVFAQICHPAQWVDPVGGVDWAVDFDSSHVPAQSRGECDDQYAGPRKEKMKGPVFTVK